MPCLSGQGTRDGSSACSTRLLLFGGLQMLPVSAPGPPGGATTRIAELAAPFRREKPRRLPSSAIVPAGRCAAVPLSGRPRTARIFFCKFARHFENFCKMPETVNTSVSLYDDNLVMYTAMINDIRQACKYIYLETFRFNEDSIGRKFRDALLEKARQGLDIRLLVDAYGTKMSSFFNELIACGGKVRYFKKMKIFISNTFARNNTRNHRKLLLIDDKITYIGSSNITAYCLNWRDLNLRLENPITRKFKSCFLHSAAQYKFYELAPFEKIKIIQYHGFGIIQDTPTAYFQPVRNHMLKMIENAKEEIIIETPYFLPGQKIRRALMLAAQKGRKVTVYLPAHSDVPVIDILANKYFGPMHKAGVEWKFYTPDLLHAKCMVVDRRRFILGSANMDYRSFRLQYEIMLYGENPEILDLLLQHTAKTRENCQDFDYEKWKNTPIVNRVMEWLLTPFRHLF